MKYIFDFDDVLFNNTTQFKEHMFRVLAEVGVPESEARKYYLEVREKEFSLEQFTGTLLRRYDLHGINSKHLYEVIMLRCREFLNSELIDMVKKVEPENCYIVTNGNKEFQQDKIKYSGIWDLFGGEKRIRIVTEDKTEAIREICEENQSSEVVFIDDKLRFIDEPGLKTISNLKTVHYESEDFERLMGEIKDKPNSEIRRQ